MPREPVESTCVKDTSCCWEEPGAINIVLVSDFLCPWCYVAKKHMEEAIAMFPDVKFNVTWCPYLLCARIPEEGIPVREYYAKCLSEKKTEVVTEAAARVGIKFTLDRLIVPTLDAHRLIEYAKKLKKQDEVIEELFREYLVEGKNISKVSVLSEIAENVGLDKEQVTQYLCSDEGIAMVKCKDNRAKNFYHIQGVPFFLISNPAKNKKIGFSGAQPIAEFLEAFKEVL